MLTEELIKKKLDELYPARLGNIFPEGKANAVQIVDTLLAQGFMDCLKFITTKK